MRESMLCKTLHGQSASETHNIQLFHWPNWHCALWRYIISFCLSDQTLYYRVRQTGCQYVNYIVIDRMRKVSITCTGYPGTSYDSWGFLALWWNWKYTKIKVHVNKGSKMYGSLFLNWWKGKPSGSIACTGKQQPRPYWSCSPVVMNDATPLTLPSAWA